MYTRFILVLLTTPMFLFSLSAQLSVSYNIHTGQDRKPISPYIFGSCNGGYQNTPFMRQGGNRITGYNWENNASHAGFDYLHQNDDYLTWISGINYPQNLQPGIVTTAFIDSCNAKNAFSAVTLQMAGYVAADKDGPVTVGQTAPSSRWHQVQNTKPGAFSMVPDTNDNVVYMDEYMNFLISTYGNANTNTGVKAYILDNETTLWPSTHPRIHPSAPTCAEIIHRSVGLATRIKQMDNAAKTFGPESYGFAEYTDYQGASDWGTYSGTYPYFLSLYLDSMRQASVVAGHRLLDVFSVHWYPDVYAGEIFSDDSSAAYVAARVQLPRSLWDSSYVEDGWIGQWFSGSLPILPTLQQQINTYYPNTELGITEYDYGADAHISGGLAQADALGAFARTGVHYASKWGAYSGFSLSAVKIYDDVAHPFQGLYTRCSSGNIQQSTIHSSIEDTVNQTLHMVVLNKNLDSTITATFHITSGISYDSAFYYWFDKTSPAIRTGSIPSAALNNNTFTHVMVPGSVYHFVLSKKQTLGINDIKEEDILLYPVPAGDVLQYAFPGVIAGNHMVWKVMDMTGKTCLWGNMVSNISSIDVSSLSRGNYIFSIQGEGKTWVRKFVK